MDVLQHLAQKHDEWPFSHDEMSVMIPEITDNGYEFHQAKVTRAQWQEARKALTSGKHSNLDNPPVGATHYIGVAVGRSKVDIHSWWMREPGDNWYVWAEPSRQWALDTPSAGQKNLMKPIHESLRKKEWDGSGLPPVGTVCERRTHPDAEGGRYERVTIIAHTSNGFPVWENTDAMFAGISKTQRMGDHPEFRPIRTPEQIAAEERKLITDDIQRICVDGENNGIPFHEALYDAGYRKAGGAV